MDQNEEEVGKQNEGIMHLIASHMTGETQEDLQELLRQDLLTKGSHCFIRLVG